MDDWGVVAAPRNCPKSDARRRSHSESCAKSTNLCAIFRAQRFLLAKSFGVGSAGRIGTPFLNGKMPVLR
jgi:hypothetical protein